MRASSATRVVPWVGARVPLNSTYLQQQRHVCQRTTATLREKAEHFYPLRGRLYDPVELVTMQGICYDRSYLIRTGIDNGCKCSNSTQAARCNPPSRCPRSCVSSCSKHLSANEYLCANTGACKRREDVRMGFAKLLHTDIVVDEPPHE